MRDQTARKLTQALRLGAVAAEDVAWLLIFAPLGVVFQTALLVLQGYYAARRKGRIWGGAYAAAAIGFLMLVIQRSIVRRKTPAR